MGRRRILEATHRGERYVMLRLGIGVFYSEKNGHAVLKHETAWHKISGIWINTKWGCWWLRFRRFGRRSVSR